MKQYLEAGKIRNTHGVKGAVKIEHWCDDATVFTSLNNIYVKHDELYKRYKLLSSSVMGDGTIIAHLEGIETFEDAARLKNIVIFADRKEIPEQSDRVFIADIIGLPVIDADTNITYGNLKDVQSGAAQELYVIQTENGDKLMPAVKEFIVSIDCDKGIFIRPITGLFD